MAFFDLPDVLNVVASWIASAEQREIELVVLWRAGPSIGGSQQFREPLWSAFIVAGGDVIRRRGMCVR